MFDIGFSELLLFGIIALIVLGPEKLPQAARTAGQWYGKLRRTVSTLQSEIEAELDLAETRKQMQEELAKIRKTEAEMKREMAEMRGSLKEFESAQSDSLSESLNPNYEPSYDYSYQSDTGDQSIEEYNEDLEWSDDYICTDKDFDYSDESTADVADTVSKDTHQVAPITTRPWENMWFRLSAYDKARRLPAPPFLPNYKADTLLHKQFSSPHIDTKTIEAKMSSIESQLDGDDLNNHVTLNSVPSASTQSSVSSTSPSANKQEGDQ